MPNVSFPGAVAFTPLRWAALKALVGTKALPLQYDEDEHEYTVYALDGNSVYQSTIWKGTMPDSIAGAYTQNQNDSDKSDFETNFKPAANARQVQPVAVTVSAPIPITMYCTVVQSQAFTITNRAETTIITYVVPAGKSLYLSYFRSALFAPLPAIFRLKVNGTTKFMALAGQNVNGNIELPAPALTATEGQTVTVTSEAQVPNGSAWVGFGGIEA